MEKKKKFLPDATNTGRYEIPGKKYFPEEVIPALYDETRGKVKDVFLSAEKLCSPVTDGLHGPWNPT